MSILDIDCKIKLVYRRYQFLSQNDLIGASCIPSSEFKSAAMN